MRRLREVKPETWDAIYIVALATFIIAAPVVGLLTCPPSHC